MKARCVETYANNSGEKHPLASVLPVSAVVMAMPLLDLGQSVHWLFANNHPVPSCGKVALLPALLYFPRGHGTCPPSVHSYPAGQEEQTDDPAPENLPDSQVVHVVAPSIIFEKVPVMQG